MTMARPTPSPTSTLQPIHPTPTSFLRQVRLLDRPQGHRQAVPLGGPALPRCSAASLAMLIRWQWAYPGRDGAAGRATALPRVGRGDHAGRLQQHLHDARADHDLLRHHADPDRRVRQLLHPADDRRAGHGVPDAQHAARSGPSSLSLVLVVASFFVQLGLGGGRLDDLPAAVHQRRHARARARRWWWRRIFVTGVGDHHGRHQLRHHGHPAAARRA